MKRIICLLSLSCCLFAGCSNKTEIEAQVTKAIMADSLSVNGSWLHVPGSFVVEVRIDMVHPQFAELEKGMSGFGAVYMGDKIKEHICLVVMRNGNTLYSISQIKNMERMVELFNSIKYDREQLRTLDAGFLFFLPEEYASEEVHLIVTEFNHDSLIRYLTGESYPDEALILDYTGFERRLN